jgi:hypothetical protein
MKTASKGQPTKKRKQNNKWTMAFYAVVLIVIICAVAFVWGPVSDKSSANNALNTELNSMPTGFKAFATNYLGVMKNLNSSQTKTEMAALLNPLTFGNDPSGSFEDPFQILDSGDGICLQWSIVYVSACLALGYQSRLVVAVDTTTWIFIHVWAEDYYKGSWVPVDPSDKAWNKPSVYLTWDWGPSIGSTVRIYAFEDVSFQDVTATYSAS